MLRLAVWVVCLGLPPSLAAGPAQEITCWARQGNRCDQSLCEESALYKVVLVVDLQAGTVRLRSKEILGEGRATAVSPDVDYEIVETSAAAGPQTSEFYVVATARVAPDAYETVLLGEYSYLSTRLTGPPDPRIHSFVGSCTGLLPPASTPTAKKRERAG